VQRIPSGIAALIVGLTSVWIVLFDRAITKAGAPPWTIVLGLVCGLAGVAILGGPGWSAASAALDTTGVMLVVASTVAWACGTMVAKHSERSPSLWAASVMQMLGGSAAAFVVAAILERDRWPTWEAVTPGSLWAIAYLVVFGSLIGFTAYVFLLQHCSAQAVATYAYVNPLVALVLGAVLAGERVPARTGLAAPVRAATVTRRASHRGGVIRTRRSPSGDPGAHVSGVHHRHHAMDAPQMAAHRHVLLETDGRLHLLDAQRPAEQVRGHPLRLDHGFLRAPQSKRPVLV
jgi:hypothetical protein